MAFSYNAYPPPTFSDAAGLWAQYACPTGAGGVNTPGLGFNHWRFWGGVTTTSASITNLGIVTLPSGLACSFIIEMRGVGPGTCAYWFGPGKSDGSTVIVYTPLEQPGYPQSLNALSSANTFQIYTAGVIGDCSVWIDLYLET